jgi:thiamine pyrophosphokinase
MTTAVIVAGGDSPPASVLEDLPDDIWVIAADSGADHALDLGISVDVVVGDLDSISPATLLSLGDSITIERFPTDKDATDLELALALAVGRGDVDEIVVVGGTGGRIDHLIANAMLMASPRFASARLRWLAHPGIVTVVHDQARLHGTPGETVSLIPVGGPARDVRTTGLRWSLNGDTLEFGSSRGVSNEFTTSVAIVSLEAGVLLAVQPHPG